MATQKVREKCKISVFTLHWTTKIEYVLQFFVQVILMSPLVTVT
jgi:hypothetical protein